MTSNDVPRDDERAAVVIVHYTDAEMTARCLRSVRNMQRAADAIYVVDNSSTDGHRLLPNEPEVVLRQSANLGFAAAVNVGLEEAWANGFNWIWLLNPDAYVEPDALGELLKLARAYPGWLVYGSWIRLDGRDQLWFRRGRFSHKTGYARIEGYEEELEPSNIGAVEYADWMTGCSLLISPEAKGTYFDREFFMYKEELEYQLRLSPSSPRAVILKRALVTHSPNSSSKTVPGLATYFLSRNHLILAARSAGRWYPVWLLSWAFRFLCQPLLRGRWHEVTMACKGAAARNLSGAAAARALGLSDTGCPSP